MGKEFSIWFVVLIALFLVFWGFFHKCFLSMENEKLFCSSEFVHIQPFLKEMSQLLAFVLFNKMNEKSLHVDILKYCMTELAVGFLQIPAGVRAVD